MDNVLVDGDLVQFQPSFGAAVVVVMPATIAASGVLTLRGKPVCVEGDEKRISVTGCSYTAGAYPIPGTGTLRVQGLLPGQRARHLALGGKNALLVGSRFTASFTVQTPAQQPAPTGPVPDPIASYIGSGAFISFNTKLRAS